MGLFCKVLENIMVVYQGFAIVQTSTGLPAESEKTVHPFTVL